MKTLFCMALAALAAVLPLGAQDVYTDNVVIVMDASGSMNEMMGGQVRKIQAAKTALKEVLRGIPADTRVGLLVFSSERPNGWVYDLGPRNDAELMTAIDRVRCGGGTPLGRNMKRGADELLKAREKQYGYGSYRLLIVTDGEANDNSDVEAFTPDIISRGITMDVIGVKMASAHTLANKVHSYRAADDPESLTRAVQEVFAEVGRTDGAGTDESAFEELAGFPAQLAPAILTGLATSGNQPIGRKPSVHSGQQASRSPQSVTPQVSTTSTSSKDDGPGISFLVFLVVAGIVLKQFFRSSSRG